LDRLISDTSTNGYHGYITLITTEILKVSQINEDIKEILKSHAKWDDFVNIAHSNSIEKQKYINKAPIPNLPLNYIPIQMTSFTLKEREESSDSSSSDSDEENHTTQEELNINLQLTKDLNFYQENYNINNNILSNDLFYDDDDFFM